MHTYQGNQRNRKVKPKMDSQLRLECQSLVKQLQSTQKLLRHELGTQTKFLESGKSVTEDIQTSNDDDRMYARNKLHGVSKTFPDDDDGIKYLCMNNNSIMRSDRQTDKVLTQQRPRQHSLERVCEPEKQIKSCFSNLTSVHTNGQDNFASEEENDTAIPSSWQPATSETQLRRQLIDRHISVPTHLSAKDLRDLDNERRLNYSYTQDDGCRTKRFELTEDKENEFKGNLSWPQKQKKCIDVRMAKGDATGEFRKQLEDDGNNRKLMNFVKDTTIKPKSLLNATTTCHGNLSSSRKNDSRVRFDTTVNETKISSDQRLLGYDWIAALLDNDSSLMNQSESFFNDLRDFRRSHKDECSNDFYMAGPHTLVDFEPEPVVEALREPKVQPYIVNERLFTEAFKPGLIDSEDRDVKGKKEPTSENPRFVRVSIPRSTLQTPYRVKPHRRRSFDASDSCSLMDNCLLGWETTWPSVIPTAKPVDLMTEAGINTKSQTTTLAEAERLASTHNKTEWPFGKPTTNLRPLPTWKKHYMNTTLNLSVPSAPNGSLTTNGSTAGSESVKRATDKLLNSTYATMYEMERLRQERQLEETLNNGKDA